MTNEELLAKIEERMDGLQDTVTAIDSAIKGDPARGVDGITQNLQTIHKNFKEHVAHDDSRFDLLETVTSNTSEQMSKAKWWLAGATFVVGGLIAFFELLLKAIK